MAIRGASHSRGPEPPSALQEHLEGALGAEGGRAGTHPPALLRAWVNRVGLETEDTHRHVHTHTQDLGRTGQPHGKRRVVGQKWLQPLRSAPR